MSRLTLSLLLFALTSLTSACTPTVRSHTYVAPGSPRAALPVVVMRPRVCTERFRPRPGTPPEHAESLAVQTLFDALAEQLPGLGDAAPVASRCPSIVDVGARDDDLVGLRAAPDVLAVMRGRRAESALVTEIAGFVTCNTSGSGARYRAFGNDGPHCYERDVQVTAFLFDRSGRVLWAARRQVTFADDAPAAVREVLSRMPAGATAGTPVTCRMVGEVADCT